MTSVKSKLFAVKKKRAASEWMRRVGVGRRWERQPPKDGQCFWRWWPMAGVVLEMADDGRGNRRRAVV